MNRRIRQSLNAQIQFAALILNIECQRQFLQEINMAGKHRDNSTRLNLERNLGVNSRNAPDDDYSLYRRDLDRMRGGMDSRPFVDPSLEREADRRSMAYLRRGYHPTQYLEGYGFSGKGPKGYRRSDESIREDVCEALYRSYEVDASGIDVDVKDGCVFLRGEVNDRQMKRDAEEAVEYVPGVIDVQNQLTLKRRQSYTESDTKLS